jgi:putative ABC transport system ATP-binding protein
VTPLLELRNVTRMHQDGTTQTAALAETSLTLERGQLVAIMGPSGSGKSTLLSLAGGLDSPTSGEVYVEGVALSGLSAAKLAALRRRRIGYVFQHLNLIEGLSAMENVSIPLELDGVARRAAHALAIEALERVGLGELAGRFPDALSGGEQQRVAVARAIVGERSLLFADEPTGSLDTLTGESVLQLLRDHCERGGASIVVTHDARLAGWADLVVTLRDGRVVDETDEDPRREAVLQALEG